MTQTPKKILFSLFDSTHLRLRHALNNDQKHLGRLSHISANSGSSVSIISVSAVNLVSHSYRSHSGHFDAVILGIPYIRSQCSLCFSGRKGWLSVFQNVSVNNRSSMLSLRLRHGHLRRVRYKVTGFSSPNCTFHVH